MAISVDVQVEEPRAPRKMGIVDCDVHNALRHRGELKDYLDERWHHTYDEDVASGGPFAGLAMGAKPIPGGSSTLDSIPENGPAGSDLDLMREQLLDRHGITHALLHPIIDVVKIIPMYGEAGLAIAAAMNDWMLDRWLTVDERLYGAITIPVEDGAASAQEIARVGGHERFVKVMVTTPTTEPMGHPRYWPIYEAAAALDLPVASHVGGVSGRCTATGWPMFHVEFHTGSYPQAFQAQVTSLVYSGIFDRFPNLQFVLEEGGVAWLPPLLWRLDRTWRATNRFAPGVDRLPSEIVRDHFWLTTQPFDVTEKREYLPQMLESLNMNDRVMFSTDYPHWDRDDPLRVLPAALIGAELREQILSANGRRLFGFEERSV